MTKIENLKLAIKQVLNCSFVLYSNNTEGIREYENVNGEYIKLNEPVKFKRFVVYKHSFGCSLNEAIKQWSCVKQILSFNRFYHSVGRDERYLQNGTRFNIFLLPIVYLYSIIDKRIFHKIAFV